MALVMLVIKQNNARKAEKALKEILDKADGNANGREELKDFMTILEINRDEMKNLAHILIAILFFKQKRWMMMNWHLFLPSLTAVEISLKMIFLFTPEVQDSGKDSLALRISHALLQAR